MFKSVFLPLSLPADLRDIAGSFYPTVSECLTQRQSQPRLNKKAAQRISVKKYLR